MFAAFSTAAMICATTMTWRYEINVVATVCLQAQHHFRQFGRLDFSAQPLLTDVHSSGSTRSEDCTSLKKIVPEPFQPRSGFSSP